MVVCTTTSLEIADALSTVKAIEEDVAQVESVGDNIATLCLRHCTIGREIARSECEKKAGGPQQARSQVGGRGDAEVCHFRTNEGEYSETPPN